MTQDGGEAGVRDVALPPVADGGATGRMLRVPIVALRGPAGSGVTQRTSVD